MTHPFIQDCLWQWLDRPGLERCELVRDGSGWALFGTILTLEGERSAEARYRIACDAAWRTTRTEVELRDRAGSRALRLEAIPEEGGRWLADSREIPAVRGAIDVDLGWSPSTNTLPIRRLGLEIGQRSEPIVAAWVRFPELTVEPLSQEYERLAERRYRYTSAGGRFSAEIDVDEYGLVLDYAGYWRRVEGS
jgi:hypothetical protein